MSDSLQPVVNTIGNRAVCGRRSVRLLPWLFLPVVLCGCGLLTTPGLYCAVWILGYAQVLSMNVCRWADSRVCEGSLSTATPVELLALASATSWRKPGAVKAAHMVAALARGDPGLLPELNRVRDLLRTSNDFTAGIVRERFAATMLAAGRTDCLSSLVAELESPDSTTSSLACQTLVPYLGRLPLEVRARAKILRLFATRPELGTRRICGAIDEYRHQHPEDFKEAALLALSGCRRVPVPSRIRMLLASGS